MEKHILLAKKFCRGEYENNLDGSIWKAAFEYLRTNSDQLEVDNTRVHDLWTVNGGSLRRKIQDDELILSVLNNTLPGYAGDGLFLYRGECQFLFKENKIGFCWTPNIEAAKTFASGLNSIESGGVLLKAYAPTEAILVGPNEHSSKQMEEFEYTCDPKLLREIEVIRLYEKRW